MLFSTSLFQLLEESIPENILSQCLHLQEFAKQFGILYGPEHEVYNVHLVTHIVDSVRELGALWNNSLYPYERSNGTLLQYRSGNNRPAVQIAIKYYLSRTCHLTKIPDHSPVRGWTRNLWISSKNVLQKYDERLKFIPDHEIYMNNYRIQLPE